MSPPPPPNPDASRRGLTHEGINPGIGECILRVSDTYESVWKRVW